MRFYHQKLSMDLLFADPSLSSKVHIFELAREGYAVDSSADSWLYTHAKNYFVDDEMMLIGSHGIERTGITNDIELSIGVADTDGAKGPDTFTGTLRRKIWAEYLSTDEDDDILVDWRSGLKEMVRQADEGVANKIRHYSPEEGANGILNQAVYEIYEPEGRCGK